MKNQSGDHISLIVRWALPVLLTALFYGLLPLYMMPGEDAAILFCYADNLAQTGTISYYPGGLPAEGATDFLFMLMVSLGVKLGLKTYVSALIWSAAASLLSCYILMRLCSARSIFQAIAVTIAIFFSTQMIAGQLGYGTIVFGSAWLHFIWQYFRGTFKNLTISALILCLLRPDGFLFAFPLVTFSWLNQKAEFKERSKQLFLLGILPGLCYFFWRWWYFGEMFPLPFYIKTAYPEKIGWFFIQASYFLNRHFVLYYMLPLAVGIFVAALRFRKSISNKEWLFLFSAIALPFIFYSSTQQDMNFGFRYQYPMYLGAVFAAFYFSEKFKLKWLLIAVIAAPVYYIPFKYKQYTTMSHLESFNYFRFTAALNGISGKAALTDAGYFAWRSKWECTDLWGLNSPAFSNKCAQPEDMAALHADMIQIGPFPWDSLPEAKQAKTYLNTVQNAYLYLHHSDYEVWQLPGVIEPVKKETIIYPWLDKLFIGPTQPKEILTFGIRPDFKEKEKLRAILTDFHAKKIR